MMFTGFNTECDSSSRCSTASPSGDNPGYYPSPAGSYSSMGSPQSQVRPAEYYSTFITTLFISYFNLLLFFLHVMNNLEIDKANLKHSPDYMLMKLKQVVIVYGTDWCMKQPVGLSFTVEAVFIHPPGNSIERV